MNAHARGGIWAVYARPPAAMGACLRRVLGRDLLILGSSSPAREEGAGQPSSIDAALARVGAGNFFLDIRARSGGPTEWLTREQSLSVNYSTEHLLIPQRTFDLLIFFTRLKPP